MHGRIVAAFACHRLLQRLQMHAQVVAVRAEMAGVHEIRWIANHRSIDLYPSLFARIIASFLEAATEALD